MKFKCGDELIYKPAYPKCMAAESGARAICMGNDSGYVKIKWIRDDKDHGQRNGGYDEEDFVLIKAKKIKLKLYGIAKWCKKYYGKS
jgi:hypothetical protein